MKRKHQIETEQIIDSVVAGGPTREIILHATTGSGKSSIPIIATKLIRSGFADALAWFVPRKTLQAQGESNFIDPFFTQMFGHSSRIRSSTNDQDPLRGLSGFSTTYQAVGLDAWRSIEFEFKRRRFIVIADEFHHLEQGGIWHDAIHPLMKRSVFKILMTGTLERGDGKPIAYLPYRNLGGVQVPDLEPTRRCAIVEYSRTDALQERAIIPLSFHLSDGSAEWVDKEGVPRYVKSIASAPKKLAGQAVYTVVSSEFADELLDKSLAHWKTFKSARPRSKMLIVTSDIEGATYVAGRLKERGYNSEIATSHESDQAEKAIRRFKKGDTDILVTIAMCYEGLDVPEITHICCLTNYRSRPWIEQMFGRGVRIDRLAGPYESQVCHVFAPDDVLMREIVQSIRLEQLPFVTIPGVQMGMFEKREGGNGGNITPVGSKLTGDRTFDLGTVSPLPAMGSRERTPGEIESDLRDKIKNHIGEYSFLGRYHNGDLNKEVFDFFGKPRAEMTLVELQAVLTYVRDTYRVEHVRGGGMRVPTKGRVWP